MNDGSIAAVLAFGAPSPPPPCPGCGGAMGDGDRVSHGRCGLCRRRDVFRGRGTRSSRRCWCGRPSLEDEADCAEHHDELAPGALAPSDPLTPGGVFDRRYP